jgi:Dolichyl-phosphate-mannose-protein mannosyltransferase
MTEADLSGADSTQSALAPSKILVWLTGIALVVAAARAVFSGWDTPIWLDETYTATIATQPSFERLIDWCLHELSGPVYYTVTWLWVKVFGESAFALRLPSLIFAAATPMLILWKGHPSRDTRLVWAVLIALWLPAVTFASQARPYALLMLLGTAQAIFFYNLIAQGGRGRALAWSIVSALLVLTHYHTLPVTAFQGLIYLVLNRREIGRTWPAALVFVPVGLWMVAHLPFVLSYMKPGVAWFSTLSLPESWNIPIALMGGNIVVGILFVVMVPMMALQAIRGITGRSFEPYSAADLATAGASILAVLALVIIGFFKPVFLLRYLVPCVPGLLFGFAVWTAAMSRRYALLPTAVIGTAIIFGAGQLGHLVRYPEQDFRHSFSFDKPSAWLQQQGVRRLVFFWDNVSASISTPERTGEMGSYFLRRNGWQGPVIVPPIAGQQIDPNIALAAIATQPGDGIIWAYDENAGDAQGVKHPPVLGIKGAPYQCRTFGGGAIKIVTCIRR